MTAQGAGRPTRLLAAALTASKRLRLNGRRASLALLLAGFGCWTAASAGPPAARAGQSDGASGEGSSAGCVSPNPPNQLTLVAGTPQTTTLGSAFASGLQVALTNSDGCAVTGAAGIPVTFSAPSGGPSGSFSSSNSNTVTVGADASGTVSAPALTANELAGSYTVTASSPYGSVSFSLTNTAAGVPARLLALPLEHASATVASGFAQPLQVRVLDADGDPVAGASVTFTLGAATPGRCATAAATASFLGGASQATASTDASGVASSPAFSANTAAGSFTASASVSSTGAGAAEGAASSVAPVSFALANLAGRPARIAPGVGATQSTIAGTPFAIRLAVTVTDSYRNPVPGALVTFSAPPAGASGRFTVRTRGPHHRARVSHPDRVEVKTGACGIAVAPPFAANARQGGYVVKASARHARAAAFALVNEAAGSSS